MYKLSTCNPKKGSNCFNPGLRNLLVVDSPLDEPAELLELNRCLVDNLRVDFHIHASKELL